MSHTPQGFRIQHLGLRDYAKVWRDMQTFTDARTDQTPDELWVLEHHPIFTLGLSGKQEHLLNPGPIPVIQTDRGGQVTYHGPGQLIAYVLYDLRRTGIGVRRMVELLQDALIELLNQYGIAAHTIPKAPGVYVANKKIASLGLRVRRGCSFHGISLNIDMDLEPFSRINPCGYPGLEVTQMKDLGIAVNMERVSRQLCSAIEVRLQKKGHPDHG